VQVTQKLEEIDLQDFEELSIEMEDKQ
jgi:hypothetical protein